MEAKYNLNLITKTLEKLFKAGFNTDKKILAMQMTDLKKIPTLSLSFKTLSNQSSFPSFPPEPSSADKLALPRPPQIFHSNSWRLQVPAPHTGSQCRPETPRRYAPQ